MNGYLLDTNVPSEFSRDRPDPRVVTWLKAHAIADRWGELDGQCQLKGRPLNTADGLIAATALEHDLTVVTRNVRHFEDLGVGIFNPWELP